MNEPSRPVFAEPMPVAIPRLTQISRGLKLLYPKQELTMTQHGRRLVFFTPGERCHCAECQDQLDPWLDDLDAIQRGMIICPECGNKRCPRASGHDFECTGSNEPGQFGSRY